MDLSNIMRALERYEAVLDGHDIEPQEHLKRTLINHTQAIAHLKTMVPQMKEMHLEILALAKVDALEEAQEKKEKLVRWLAFMQGVLWKMGFFNIDELKSHNR